MIGRYVVLAEVGAGGMGVVYAAYDPELDRKVAIKLLHPDGRDPRVARLRLQREAKAMAMLSHPNVANVHDVGTIDDRVWVAMEFVTGETLTRWLAAAPRSWREILGVFVQIGRGLAAAHAEGLLHRDVKPDNMMIDANGRARVLDFGVARSDDQRTPVVDQVKELALTKLQPEPLRPAVTRPGALVGTPAYMAPEQFELRTVDTRADQFAFCVALWEGLYGERPFAGKGVQEIARSVTRGERRAAPKSRRVPMFVRRALERGLSVRPDDRWPTMDALLGELARDPGRRRTRWIVGSAMTLALGLGAFGWWRSGAEQCTGAAQALAGVWDEDRRAQAQAAVLGTAVSYAPAMWQRVAPRLDAWADGFIAMHTEACEATRRGEQSAAVLDLRMACLHRAKLGLVATTNVLAEATPQAVENAHELVAALPPISHCADAEALAADVPPPEADEADEVDVIRAELAEANARRGAGDYDGALAAVQRAEARLDGLRYEPIRTEVLLVLGTARMNAGNLAEAEAALGEAQQLGARWKQWHLVFAATTASIAVIGYHGQRPAEALALRNLALGLSGASPEYEMSVRTNLGNVSFAQGEYERAEAEYRAALELGQPALGDDHPKVVALRNNIAEILRASGRYADAEAEHRAVLAIREQTLGPEHPDVAQSRDNLAGVLVSLGRLDEAEAEQRAALELRRRALGDEHPLVATSRQNLAEVLRERGELAEAEQENRVALAILEKVLGPTHSDVAAPHNNLGRVLAAQGKSADAAAEYRAALAIREQTLGPDHPEVLLVRSNLGNLLADIGDLAGSEAELRAVLAVRERALGPDHPIVSISRHNLAIVLHRRGAYEQAEREARAALAAREKALDAEHPDVASSRHVLADVLRARGAHDEAETQERAALEVRERVLGPDHPYVAMSLTGLGRTLAAKNRLDEAVTVLDRAWTIVEPASAPAWQKAETAFALAAASWPDPARRQQALALARKALALYSEGADATAIAEVEAWLDQHAP